MNRILRIHKLIFLRFGFPWNYHRRWQGKLDGLRQMMRWVISQSCNITPELIYIY